MARQAGVQSPIDYYRELNKNPNFMEDIIRSLLKKTNLSHRQTKRTVPDAFKKRRIK